MMNKEIKGTEEDNNKVLTFMLSEEIKKARAFKNPSAEDLVNNIPIRRIIYK